MKKVLFVFTLMLSMESYSQAVSLEKSPEPSIEGENYRGFFWKKIHSSFDKHLSSLGIHGTAFIRFTLSDSGYVSGIMLDSATMKIKPLATFLNNMISQTSGKWNPKTCAGISEILILPICYTLQYKGLTRPVPPTDIKELIPDVFEIKGFRPVDFFPVKILFPVHYISPFVDF